MFSDDVYRSRLSEVIATLDAWADSERDCARITTSSTPNFWKMTVAPEVAGACPFELLLRSDQRFNVQIAGEFYEEKPVDTFEFFPMMARAIARGNVEHIEVANALTDALEAVETRVTLEDGWAWIGERRIARPARRVDGAQQLRSHCFLPYRR